MLESSYRVEGPGTIAVERKPAVSTATVTPITRPGRTATAARWQKALARAIAQDIAIRLEASTGMAVVTSGTDDTPPLCHRRADVLVPGGRRGRPGL